MHKIFVYGTLMAGCGNHRLLKDSKFLQGGRTLPHFTMISLGGFPGVLPDGKNAIEGEVYEVSDQDLIHLDQLEGHPDWYRRTPTRLQDGTEVEIYLYPEAPPRVHVIESGSWRQYRGGVHGR